MLAPYLVAISFFATLLLAILPSTCRPQDIVNTRPSYVSYDGSRDVFWSVHRSHFECVYRLDMCSPILANTSSQNIRAQRELGFILAWRAIRQERVNNQYVISCIDGHRTSLASPGRFIALRIYGWPRPWLGYSMHWNSMPGSPVVHHGIVLSKNATSKRPIAVIPYAIRWRDAIISYITLLSCVSMISMCLIISRSLVRMDCRRCPRCGYSLIGVTLCMCPECGHGRLLVSGPVADGS